jgi:crotonobetainyl-CoA:carnitine CoA-transferase CaiB-like acyl-CoA transferase
VLEHPHTEATALLVKYDHPYGGSIQSVGLPFMLGKEPREAGTPPPMHGEHTHAILQEMGFSSKQIEELRAAKAIV